jgi:heme a synthase
VTHFSNNATGAIDLNMGALTSLSTRLEGYRQRAVDVDGDTSENADALGQVVRGVRYISRWNSSNFRNAIVASLIIVGLTGVIGQQFASSSIIRYTASVFNTLAIMALAVFVLGRWVRVSASTFRRIALVSGVLLGFIILTGAAVRLTGSGLGCTDWPTCNNGKVVPASSDYHGVIEFGNRIVTGLCVFAAGVGVLASLVRIPYRRDLVKLGGIVVAAIMGNAVLGGLTVLVGLKPQFVMSHFLLAIASLAFGLLLFHRSNESGGGGDLFGRDRLPVISSTALIYSRLLTVSAFVTLLIGTILTGSGPHGGSAETPRFGFSMDTVARIHSIAAWCTVALSLVMIRLAFTATKPGPAAQRLMHRAKVLVVILIIQGAIGYVQWFTQVPARLVQLHVLGAVLVWSAVLWLRAAITMPADVNASRETAPRSTYIPVRRAGPSAR